MRATAHLLALAALAAGALAPMPARAWDPVPKSTVSRSHQFVVYSDDENARSRVAEYADDTKDKFLEYLQLPDDWKRPIVIQLRPQDTASPGGPISSVRIYDTEDGFKVELDVTVGPDMRQARFPQQLVRALLLEFAYRDQPALVRAGAVYGEPPAWVIEGLACLVTEPDAEIGPGLFKSLIDGGKTPALGDFLAEKADNLDTPSREIYDACAMSLVRLLAEQPGGRQGLQNFIRHWPGPQADPEGELLKSFPGLNSGAAGLEKWWTLGLARLSAADRYQGLSLEETSRRLDALLTFDVVLSRDGQKKQFTLAQYADFRKAPGARPALLGLSERLLGLEAESSPLLREVVETYKNLAAELAYGKSRHLLEQTAAAEEYRKRVIGRMDAIADYLNWYEVNEQTVESGAFDEYLRTAGELDKKPERHDAISNYMDAFERELQE